MVVIIFHIFLKKLPIQNKSNKILKAFNFAKVPQVSIWLLKKFYYRIIRIFMINIFLQREEWWALWLIDPWKKKKFFMVSWGWVVWLWRVYFVCGLMMVMREMCRNIIDDPVEVPHKTQSTISDLKMRLIAGLARLRCFFAIFFTISLYLFFWQQFFASFSPLLNRFCFSSHVHQTYCSSLSQKFNELEP